MQEFLNILINFIIDIFVIIAIEYPLLFGI